MSYEKTPPEIAPGFKKFFNTFTNDYHPINYRENNQRLKRGY